MWHLTTLLLQVLWWGKKVFVWLTVFLCKHFFSGHLVLSLWRNILLTHKKCQICTGILHKSQWSGPISFLEEEAFLSVLHRVLIQVSGSPPRKVMECSNLNVISQLIKVCVERHRLDVVSWPLRRQDRLISSISSVCGYDHVRWLPRVPGPGRPTYSSCSWAIPNRAAVPWCP